jgi:hypothetical protein
MRSLPALTVLLTLSAALPAASIYTETWNNQQANGWFLEGIANPSGGTVTFPGGVPTWTASEPSGPFNRGFLAQAQPSSSGGLLTGDYLAVGATAIQFDFALDSDSLNENGASLTVLIAGLGPGFFNNYWTYTFTLPAIGSGMHTFSAPLSGAGWVQTVGTGTFQQAAQTVGALDIRYSRTNVTGAFTASGRIDNVGLVSSVPEPAPTFLVGFAMGAYFFFSRFHSSRERTRPQNGQ